MVRPALVPARSRDAAAIARLSAACLPAPWSVAAWEGELRRPDARVWLARGPAGAPAGFVAARFAPDAAQLLALAVVPELRRRGLGRALLERVVRAAGRAGLTRIEVETPAGDVRARRFYRSQGFVAVGRRPRYYAHAEDALLLTRALATLRDAAA